MNCSACGREITSRDRLCPHCGNPQSGEIEDDSPGTRFDIGARAVLANRFELLHKLGSGGMGEVWLANDQDLQEQVAIKLLREDLACDGIAMHAMRDEVKIARRLTHPNILRIHELHEHGDRRFISMEYIDGESLQALRFREGGRLTLDRLIPLARQIAAALDYAHANGVLHRDVKPGNMLVDKTGKASLADFGIARIAHDANTRLTGRPSSGTLAYMSLEQLDNVRSARNDPRSDVYSFAVSLYELLTGEPPFSGGDLPGQIRSKAPDPIGGIPPHVNTAILKSLSKDRSQRHGSCEALLDAMEGRAPKTSQKYRAVGIIVAALVLLVVGAVVLGHFIQPGRPLSPGSSADKKDLSGPVEPPRPEPQTDLPKPSPPTPPVSEVHLDHTSNPNELIVQASASYVASDAETAEIAQAAAYDKVQREATAAVADYLKTLVTFDDQPQFRKTVDTWAGEKTRFNDMHISGHPSGALVAAIEGQLDLKEFRQYVEALKSSGLSSQARQTPFEIDFGFYHQNGRRMSDASALSSGEQFWIEFKSSRDCYVYILNYAPSGKVITLYPRTDIDTEPRLVKNQWVRLPNNDYNYQTDKTTGQEKIVLVASLAPLKDIEFLLQQNRRQATSTYSTLLDSGVGTRDIGVAPVVEAAKPHSAQATPQLQLEVEKLQGRGSLVRTIVFEHRS